MKIKIKFFYIIRLFLLFILPIAMFFVFVPNKAYADNVGNTFGWAWSERSGWIHFNGDASSYDYGVVTDGDGLSGEAFAENGSYLRFSGSCDDTGGCPDSSDTYATSASETCSVGVRCLSGWAWGEGLGWVRMAASGSDYSNDSTSDYGVYIDSDGGFHGYAWGETTGYIKFSGSCDDTGGCPDSSDTYGVETNFFPITEFVSIVDPDNGTGTDYTSLSAWEGAVQTDLTAYNTLVFSHGGITGAIADTDTVSGLTSGATADVVHATTDQILLEAISGTFQSGEQIQVDGSNYVTISDAGNSAISVATCRSTAGTPDRSYPTISGWITSATNYIKIWTDPDDPYGRHDGKWDDAKYQIAPTASTYQIVDIHENYTVIDGLQFDVIGSGNYDWTAITTSAAVTDVYILNNIARYSYAGAGAKDATLFYLANTAGNRYAYNNILYNNTGTRGTTRGLEANYNTNYFLNNTISGFHYGLLMPATGATVNNIILDCDIDFGSHATVYSNNISDDSTAPGSNSQTNVTLADLDFVSTTTGSEDFHIGYDSVARDAGADLSSTFTDDIDGDARDVDGAGWDIGADESSPDFVSKIRVNTEADWDFDKLSTWEAAIDSDLTATTSKLYTVSDTGTFDDTTDQSQAVTFTGGGTGTLLDINSSGIAYITGVTGTVTAGTVTVDSTSHTFVISNTGAKVGRAIAECYNDWPSGLEDSVIISGWTAGENNYVKIYTPLTERHNGVYGTGFLIKKSYNYHGIIRPEDYYTEIDGLEIENTGSYGSGIFNENGSVRYIKVSNNILKGNGSTQSGHTGINIESGSSSQNYIYNNIIYDWNIGLYGRTTLRSDWKAYNNTIVDNRYGIYVNSGVEAYDGTDINNIVAFNTVANFTNLTDTNKSNNASDDLLVDIPGSSAVTGITSADFVDSGNSDYHLSSSSKLRDVGVDLSSVFTKDIDGYVRGLFNAWDIGADEFLESSTRIKGGVNIKGGVKIINP